MFLLIQHWILMNTNELFVGKDLSSSVDANNCASFSVNIGIVLTCSRWNLLLIHCILSSKFVQHNLLKRPESNPNILQRSRKNANWSANVFTTCRRLKLRFIGYQYGKISLQKFYFIFNYSVSSLLMFNFIGKKILYFSLKNLICKYCHVFFPSRLSSNQSFLSIWNIGRISFWKLVGM